MYIRHLAEGRGPSNHSVKASGLKHNHQDNDQEALLLGWGGVLTGAVYTPRGGGEKRGRGISRTHEDAVHVPGLQTKAKAVHSHRQGPREVSISKEGAIGGADEAGSGTGGIVLGG